jgi:hypothetical protein
MSDLYDLDPLSPADARLHADAPFGPLNYPDDLAHRDQYFREGFALIQTMNQPQKVRKVIASYIHYATDPLLRLEVEQFLQSLPEESQ